MPELWRARAAWTLMDAFPVMSITTSLTRAPLPGKGYWMWRPFTSVWKGAFRKIGCSPRSVGGRLSPRRTDQRRRIDGWLSRPVQQLLSPAAPVGTGRLASVPLAVPLRENSLRRKRAQSTSAAGPLEATGQPQALSGTGLFIGSTTGGNLLLRRNVCRRSRYRSTGYTLRTVAQRC